MGLFFLVKLLCKILKNGAVIFSFLFLFISRQDFEPCLSDFGFWRKKMTAKRTHFNMHPYIWCGPSSKPKGIYLLSTFRCVREEIGWICIAILRNALTRSKCQILNLWTTNIAVSVTRIGRFGYQLYMA